MADTALRTADSGYLTRRLVDVSQDVIIREHDCGTNDGIWVFEINDGNQVIEPFAERLVGPLPGGRLVDPDDQGNVLVSKDKMMNDDDAKIIADAGVTRIKIRTRAHLPCPPRRVRQVLRQQPGLRHGDRSRSAKRWVSSRPSPSANRAPS